MVIKPIDDDSVNQGGDINNMLTSELDEKGISSQLKKICETYTQSEKDFAKTILPIFRSLLPEDFDMSILDLEAAMANIIANKDLGIENSCHLVRIPYSYYNSNKLFEHLKKQNLIKGNGIYKNNCFIKNLDGLKIEFEPFNLNDKEDVRLINIRIKLTSLSSTNVIEKSRKKITDAINT